MSPKLIATYPIRLLSQVLKGDVFACVNEDPHNVRKNLLVQEHIGRPEVQRTAE
jgi:hypothetical protein